MQVTFKPTKKMPRHNGTHSFVANQTRDLPDAEAARLCKDFPDNFSIESPPAAKMKKPTKNKMVGGGNGNG